MPREFFFNADFDLTLRGAPSLLDTSDPTFVHEMAWHFLFAAEDGDSVILHRPLPPGFVAYMAAKGFALPRTVLHPDYTAQSLFTPFGWNSMAMERRSLYSDQPVHPSLQSVKAANSRAFCQALEREWAEADGMDWSPSTHGRLCKSMPELAGFLAQNPRNGGWMVKGDHGHAGTANRRLPEGALQEADRKILVLMLEEHGQAVVEPWHDRILDMSANFTAGPGGGVSDFRGHELFNSRDGAFLGVKILPDRQPPSPWRAGLEIAAARLGRALDGIGYFGPVSMDAYVWRGGQGGTEGESHLRPLVDINARHSMALPIHGLARRLPGKHLLWTWIKPRKLSLPGSYAELDARLGERAFNPVSKTGILPISPIWPADGKGMAKRIGFLFCADGEEELANLRTDFAAALGRA